MFPMKKIKKPTNLLSLLSAISQVAQRGPSDRLIRLGSRKLAEIRRVPTSSKPASITNPAIMPSDSGVIGGHQCSKSAQIS